MKCLILALLVVLSGCNLPTGLIDHLAAISTTYNVGSVMCDNTVLSLASRETDALTPCAALNIEGTRIEPPSIVTWRSSVPSAVSINTLGQLRAETVVQAGVVITATGTDGTSASVLVESVL